MTNPPTLAAVQERRHDRAYPVEPDEGNNDTRFTMGLLHDVIKVVRAHGYPELTGLDMAELQLSLFCFLYREDAAR